MVNGIIASPFGSNHMIANLFYNIHRVIYSSAPRLLRSKVLQSANEVITRPQLRVYGIDATDDFTTLSQCLLLFRTGVTVLHFDM